MITAMQAAPARHAWMARARLLLLLLMALALLTHTTAQGTLPARSHGGTLPSVDATAPKDAAAAAAGVASAAAAAAAGSHTTHTEAVVDGISSRLRRRTLGATANLPATGHRLPQSDSSRPGTQAVEASQQQQSASRDRAASLARAAQLKAVLTRPHGDLDAERARLVQHFNETISALEPGHAREELLAQLREIELQAWKDLETLPPMRQRGATNPNAAFAALIPPVLAQLGTLHPRVQRRFLYYACGMPIDSEGTHDLAQQVATYAIQHFRSDVKVRSVPDMPASWW